MATRQELTPGRPRHLKVTGPAPMFGYEPCEDVGCAVEAGGIASSCGRTACPSCGCGGTNLTVVEHVHELGGLRLRCTCGHAWVLAPRPPLTAPGRAAGASQDAGAALG